MFARVCHLERKQRWQGSMQCPINATFGAPTISGAKVSTKQHGGLGRVGRRCFWVGEGRMGQAQKGSGTGGLPLRQILSPVSGTETQFRLLESAPAKLLVQT